MRKIQNQNLAQLLLQLKFTPPKKRREQLEAAEKLFAIIELDKEYPFEFIIFHITGFRPKGDIQWESIKGDELLDDLRIFIAKLSGLAVLPVTTQKQKVYRIEEIAEELNVSTKTIQRWRKRGLFARKFIFQDGKKRFGFLQSTVDKFLNKNPDLVEKARKFTRLTNKEKQRIIKKAASLVVKTRLSRYQIIETIAAELGKAHETVRYLLNNYEKIHPDSNLFEKPSGVINSSLVSEIYKLYKQGAGIEELMEHFNRSRSSIYRLINQKSARILLARKIEFVDSNEFLREDAYEDILAAPLGLQDSAVGKNRGTLNLAGSSMPDYLRILKNTPTLNRQRETELFRRYNYLKYLATRTRIGLKPANASGSRLRKIEQYLAEAELIKKMIIEANLRLVVSIANKHTSQSARLLDLVSEGNFSLMRAVEKFDYTRGFRFATYAGWVITKDFARIIPAETARPDKAGTESVVNIGLDLRTEESLDFAAIERARQSLVQVVKDNLDKREEYIILNHFGLIGSLIKKDKKTLAQIGEDLGLSKERVRQIELTALQKLKYSMSIKEFELLIG